MNSAPTLKVAGLETSNNPFSSVKEGGLAVARNIVVNADNTAQPRPGQYVLTATSYNEGYNTQSGTYFDGRVITHAITSDLAIVGIGASPGIERIWRSDAVNLADYENYSAVDNSTLRMKFVHINDRLLMNTSAGLKALDAGASTLRDTSIVTPSIVYGNTAFHPSAPNGWVSADNQLGLRATFGYYNSDGAFIESAPSDRVVLTYGSGAPTPAYLQVEIGEINDLPDDYFVRLYTTDLSGSENADPGDEMLLVREVLASDYTDAVTFYIYDSSGLSAVPLYTNPRSGDTILAANRACPVAKDIASGNGRLWAANTTGRQYFNLELIGVGPSDGLQVGDTITIGSETFTGVVGPTFGASEFVVDSSSTPSANITTTVRNLADCINDVYESRGDNAFRAYVVGGNEHEAPGKLYIEYSDITTTTPYYVYSSRSTCWSPALTPVASGTTVAYSSSGDVFQNAVYYSKPNQPESFPLLNYVFVGSQAYGIKRICWLRNRLFVFKDDGIFTISGDEPFTIEPLDTSARLLFPDSVAVLNNQILCFTTQGVCAVSDAGVRILSRSIETDLAYYQVNASSFARGAFAVANEKERRYELWVPVGDPEVCDLAFVYNTVTQTWVTWDGERRRWGVASANDDNVYYGGPYEAIATHRSTGSSEDFRGKQYSLVLQAIAPYISVNGVPQSAGVFTVSWTHVSAVDVGRPTPQVGDVVYMRRSDTSGDTSTTPSIITSVTDYDSANGKWTLTFSVAGYFYLIGTVQGYQRLDCEMRWNPFHYGVPGQSKTFSFAQFHFTPSNFALGEAMFTTEQDNEDSSVTIATPATSGWGNAAWGGFAWGQTTRYFGQRLMIPLEKTRGTMITVGFRIREGNASWKLQGVTMDVSGVSERTST